MGHIHVRVQLKWSFVCLVGPLAYVILHVLGFPHVFEILERKDCLFV